MMLPPGESADDVYAPYDPPRGTCPRCGSGSVGHLAIGLPAGPVETAGTPAWVHWVGCLHPGHDRECEGCGFAWLAARSSEELEPQ